MLRNLRREKMNILTTEQRQAWDRDGFFIQRKLVPTEDVARIEAEVIGRIRSDPPSAHPGKAAYNSGNDCLITVETAPTSVVSNPEDLITKVFNCHVDGQTYATSQSQPVTDYVADLLGPELMCFQSQFIFKNPGVIGQPWHQDSYYFHFTQQPQIGVWVALSRATLENGCLWVLPGSHREKIQRHVPDRRPEANKGYLEIVDHDFAGRVPVLMEPGDVLFFHSYLMHMSTDNHARERRAAMVYHYGRADTKYHPDLSQETIAALQNVNRWVPVQRVVR
jgi:phytanoyl-CoA hydroxylase